MLPSYQLEGFDPSKNAEEALIQEQVENLLRHSPEHRQPQPHEQVSAALEQERKLAAEMARLHVKNQMKKK